MKKRNVYIGTYTQTNPQEPHRSQGIFHFFVEPGGVLTAAGDTAAGINPSYLTLHPNRAFLYCVNESAQGGVSAMKIDPDTGALELLNSQPTGGADPCYVSADPTGRWLLAANYSGGNLSVHPIQADGRLGPIAEFVQHTGTGPNTERQEKAHAHSIRFDPSGQYVLAADLGMDQVLIYRMDGYTGKLALHTVFRSTPGSGPRHFDFSAQGNRIYVANELDSTVSVGAWDAQMGEITWLQTAATLPDDFNGVNIVADIHIHPSGKYLYVSNRGHQSLVCFAIDPGTGLLERRGWTDTGGKWPRNFAIDPDGRLLYVANQHTDNILTFAIDAETGTLSRSGQEIFLPSPVCVLIAK